MFSCIFNENYIEYIHQTLDLLKLFLKIWGGWKILHPPHLKFWRGCIPQSPPGVDARGLGVGLVTLVTSGLGLGLGLAPRGLGLGLAPRGLGLGLGLAPRGLGLGLGLVTSGLVNIPGSLSRRILL